MIEQPEEDDEIENDNAVFDAVEEEADEINELAIGLQFLRELRKLTEPENQHETRFDNFQVQRAYEDMMISAYERMIRIFRADIPPDKEELP